MVEWATRGGSKALGWDSHIGSLEVGKKADIVLLKNDEDPAMTPVINPYGHVVYQAQRADVHTVVINGRIVKRDHKLLAGDLPTAKANVERTIEYLVGQMGDAFRAKRYEEGLTRAVQEVTSLLVRHFPATPGQPNPNELPDQPVLGGG